MARYGVNTEWAPGAAECEEISEDSLGRGPTARALSVEKKGLAVGKFDQQTVALPTNVRESMIR